MAEADTLRHPFWCPQQKSQMSPSGRSQCTLPVDQRPLATVFDGNCQFTLGPLHRSNRQSNHLTSDSGSTRALRIAHGLNSCCKKWNPLSLCNSVRNSSRSYNTLSDKAPQFRRANSGFFGTATATTAPDLSVKFADNMGTPSEIISFPLGTFLGRGIQW